METIGGGLLDNKKTFLGHIFCNTEESKAEFLNVMQYLRKKNAAVKLKYITVKIA